MTKAGELYALAQRCEQAVAPDVMLERDIAVALGWRHLPNKGPARDEYPFCWVAPDGMPDFDGFPDYVHSLDAAMTLVPDGKKWMLETRFNGYHAEVAISGVDAATPALALCSAALKARAASAGEGSAQDAQRLDPQGESAAPKADAP